MMLSDTNRIIGIIFFLFIDLGYCRDLSLNFELRPPFVYENNLKCSIENTCLSLNTQTPISGSDNLGQFGGYQYEATTSIGTLIYFTVRDYGGFQIYEQLFPQGLDGTSNGDKDDVATGWPVFLIPDEADTPGLRFVTPGGYMLGWTLYAQGSFAENISRFRDGESGGLVGFILPEGGIYPSILMSALTEPMAANVKLIQGPENLLQWGIQGLAESIPVGFSIQFIVVSNSFSFNRNVIAWGQLLQDYFETSKDGPDISVDYVGYWTDNGAAHYYNPLPYVSYQNMIIDVYNQTKANNIPIRYIQLDSWWYYKGEEGGVKNWTAKPYIFPDGIEYIYEQTGWPIVAHNRYFSNDTVYAIQNGGSYPFTIDDSTSKALPLDKTFWDDLFDEALSWGLYTYEQDWLDRQYEATSALHTNITLGSSWLNNMGLAAQERGIRVQYCMAFPRHFIHSVQLPAVTQIRVSDDYILTPNQWRIGISSLFAHAVGLKPFKDNFWTSRENKNVVFNDCQLDIPDDIQHPLRGINHKYGGRKAVTKNNETCVAWTTFGYDVLYPHSGMRTNLCRDPLDEKRGAFCYTKASFDLPEAQWEWDFCKPPLCQIDCYTFNGVGYLGGQDVTENGYLCVNGSVCRNPDLDIAPWCYIDEAQTLKDYCDNKCVEAVEPNSYLQSAVSTLSSGPVGFGDRVENLNKDLIMKSVRTDGLILKPSRPLTAIDLLFISKDYREIWTTQSIISGYDFGIIFIAEINRSLELSAFDLNLETSFSTDTLLWQNYPSSQFSPQLIIAGDNSSFPACGGHLEFCLWYTSPLFVTLGDRYSILGESLKWTVVSPQRIANINVSSGETIITVNGVTGELVNIKLWRESDNSLINIDCTFTSDGNKYIYFSSQTCQ